MVPQNNQPKHEPLYLRLAHYLVTFISGILLSDYLKGRIWLLLGLLLFFLLIGVLSSKNILQIILVIGGYIILVFIFRWIENRTEK